MVYLRNCMEDGVIVLEPYHVADMMQLVKISRNQFVPSWSNYEDMAGYAGCGAEAAGVEP